jgi:polar amino acid transport system permease protein
VAPPGPSDDETVREETTVTTTEAPPDQLGARASGTSTHDAALPRARPLHLGRWAISLVLIGLLALFIRAVADNPNLDWDIVGKYLFDPTVLNGVKNTIIITVLSQAIGIGGGLLLALARLSRNPVLRVGAGSYIWFFRGVPVLVQLIFWFNLGLVFPMLALGIPGTSAQLFSVSTNVAITPFVAVLLGLGLNEMAYMAEIVRGGLLGVPNGQREAAASLGMTPLQTLRKIVLPQAVRMIIPPTSNQTIIMLKISALASVITYQDLLTSVQLIYSVNLRTLELLIVASIWYVVLTTLLTFGQSALERRMGRSLVTVTPVRRNLAARLIRMGA